jgi:hypothetical protein
MVTAWVTRTDLPAGTPGGEVDLDAAASLASAVLFALSGRRWAGHATRTITILPFWEGRTWWPGWPTSGGWAGSGFSGDLLPWPVLCAGEIGNVSTCSRPPAIRLPDYPVRAVTEVTVNGAVRDPASYRLTGSRYLDDGWDGWAVCACGRDRPMTVTYEYGADPPDAGRAAAVRLATELAKLAAGQSTALPGYLKQRVRQGETLTYVDAATLFDKGKTGLGDVDMWLSAVNPGGLRRRSRAWSPDTDPNYTTTGGTTP